MSFAGLEHGGQGNRHGCGSSLVAVRQECSCLARSPGPPSYAVAGAAVGAGCARVPPVSHGGFWKNFLFHVACLAALFALGKLDTSTLPSYLPAYSGVWVQCIGFFRRSFVHLTWFDSGRRLLSILAEWRSVHSRCFWLQLLSARFARFFRSPRR